VQRNKTLLDKRVLPGGLAATTFQMLSGRQSRALPRKHQQPILPREEDRAFGLPLKIV
jgi:hypothetical protein